MTIPKYGGQHYSGKSSEIISLQQRIAADLAEKLRPKLNTDERRQVTNEGTQNPEAYDLYLKGRHAWSQRTATGTYASIDLFNQAVAKDPKYAVAYVGLADAYAILPVYAAVSSIDAYPKSNTAARKALELDSTLAHAHAVLAINQMQFDRDFAGGEAEYKKAFELDPTDATAHQWYGEDLAFLGRAEESAEQINRAHELDPASLIIAVDRGSLVRFAGHPDEGIPILEKIERENPTYGAGHLRMAELYWDKRMYPEVVREYKQWGELSGDPGEAKFAAALDEGFRNGGWKAALTKAIQARLDQRKSSYAQPWQIARLYADLGDKDAAFHWLDVAYQERDYEIEALRTEPRLNSLHSDPRFAALVKRLGFPQ